jgi:hypothetical protein
MLCVKTYKPIIYRFSSIDNIDLKSYNLKMAIKIVSIELNRLNFFDNIENFRWILTHQMVIGK